MKTKKRRHHRNKFSLYGEKNTHTKKKRKTEEEKKSIKEGELKLRETKVI